LPEVNELDPIPFADVDGEAETVSRVEAAAPALQGSEEARGHVRTGTALVVGLISSALLCALHGLAIWWGLGGLAGLRNGWPLWRDDHTLYYHSALVTRSFLKLTATTAGYDPSFMAGYAKSVVFPTSSTLPELAVAAFGGRRPELAYKLYVLIAAAAVPWLVAAAGALWRVRPAGLAWAIALELLYIWTDFPINYVGFGMVPYFLSIPLGLVATGAFARFLERRGLLRWLASTALMSFAFLVHLTSAMIMAPAALVGYAMISLARGAEPGTSRAAREARRVRFSRADARRAPTGRLGISGHAAVWLIPLVVLALNAFWWLPGIWLASTKGPSDFAFAHPEGVARRLGQIFNAEPPIQSVLLATGLPGLALLVGRRPAQGWILAGFGAAGFVWGYLAGGIRGLDFLQPGRHTFACYTALALAGGAALDELFTRLRFAGPARDAFGRWVMACLTLAALRVLGFPCGGINLFEAVRLRLFGGEPFLSSRPSQRLVWVIEHVKRHVQPGERLLYEEGGWDLPGESDPFQRGRFSGLLPERTGVEVIGGPYLHASLTTNFTQFGEGMLFGKKNWDREHFVRYAKLYRPAAILCWSRHARRFCRENPDLVRVVEDDGAVLIGRIEGFGGEFIEGSGTIEAKPGVLRIHNASAGLDGSLVLRYHSVPCLKTRPEVACEREYREEDPVPFIRLRPAPETRDIEVELHFPGWR
jgi:hypothetical protein